jgi:DNA-binding transcriptional LysR family regulator
MDLTQPTASRVIAGLEHELGASLFTRTTRAVVLTEAGTDYLLRVEGLLHSLEEADHEVRGSKELRGVLRVGISSSLAIRYIIPRLSAFTLAHPALRVELLMDDRRQDLVTEGVDVALRFGPMDDSSAVARLIATWPRIIAASPAYLERCGTPKVPVDLAAHTMIAVSRGTGGGWSFGQNGREVSVRIDNSILVTVLEGAIAAATAGLGIVSTTSPACRKEMGEGKLVRLLPDWDMGSFDLHAVFASGRAAKPSAKAFAEFLREALSDL